MFTGISLDPVALEPLYRQLRDRVAELVVQHELPPGAMLPSEHALCRNFGVSRTVVRHALAELESDGVVERIKGKGTFVARGHTTPERLAHTLVGLHEEATARGASVRSVVRRREWATPPPAVAEALRIGKEDSAVVLERLRFVDDEPWSLTTTWLPARLADVVLATDFTSASLYLTLRAAGTVASSGVRAVEAETAPPATAELLGLRPGDALLVLHSVSYDQRGEPMEVFVAYHRSDRSRFEFQLGAAALAADDRRLEADAGEEVPISRAAVRPLPTPAT